jgi:hypothetical protein
MPTEVTPAPFPFQQLRLSLEHRPSYLNQHPFPIAPSGSVRAMYCSPGPRGIFPNRMGDHRAPYASGAYTPEHDTAAATLGYRSRLLSNSLCGSDFDPGRPGLYDGRSSGGNSYGRRTSIGMDVGSVGGPRSSLSRSYFGSSAESGGDRVYDAWEGAMLRSHTGYHPDMTSMASAIPRLASLSGSWLQSPSSPLNHARMTPGAIPELMVVASDPLDHRRIGTFGEGVPEYRPPPVTHSTNQPRRSDMRAIRINPKSSCNECYQAGVEAGSRFMSPANDHRHEQRMSVEGSPRIGETGPLYRKI